MCSLLLQGWIICGAYGMCLPGLRKANLTYGTKRVSVSKISFDFVQKVSFLSRTGHGPCESCL